MREREEETVKGEMEKNRDIKQERDVKRRMEKMLLKKETVLIDLLGCEVEAGGKQPHIVSCQRRESGERDGKTKQRGGCETIEE